MGVDNKEIIQLIMYVLNVLEMAHVVQDALKKSSTVDYDLCTIEHIL